MQAALLGPCFKTGPSPSLTPGGLRRQPAAAGVDPRISAGGAALDGLPDPEPSPGTRRASARFALLHAWLFGPTARGEEPPQAESPTAPWANFTGGPCADHPWIRSRDGTYWAGIRRQLNCALIVPHASTVNPCGLTPGRPPSYGDGFTVCGLTIS